MEPALARTRLIAGSIPSLAPHHPTAQAMEFVTRNVQQEQIQIVLQTVQVMEFATHNAPLVQIPTVAPMALVEMVPVSKVKAVMDEAGQRLAPKTAQAE